MIGKKLKMSKIAWRDLVRGTASVFLAAGLAVPALADEAGDQGAIDAAQSESLDTFVLSDPLPADVLTAEGTESEGPASLDGAVQVAQGVTSYDRRRRLTDQPARGQTVTSRPRPQYDPLGVRMGSFVLLPQLDVVEQYETNIFATEDDEEDDFITRIIPNLTLQSDWNNHQVRFETGADVGRYWENSREDYEDYFVGASGRVDIRRSTQLNLGTQYRRAHESNEDPDDAGAAAEHPTELNLYSADVALRHDFGRFNATVAGGFDRITYEDPDARNPPPNKIIEHDRDRNVYEGRVRVGYEIQPQYEAFVLGSYNQRRYDGDEVGTGINRDSDGYAVALGMAVDFGGVIFGDFYAGYRVQDYDDSSLDDISGLGGGADITWNVTGLTTIVGSLTGDIRETTDPNASGRQVATGRVRVDHELRRNILLGGEVSATRDDYEGISRTDWFYTAGANGTYLINRYLRGGVSYEFRQRNADSGFSGEDFTNHVFLVRLGLQY